MRGATCGCALKATGIAFRGVSAASDEKFAGTSISRSGATRNASLLLHQRTRISRRSAPRNARSCAFLVARCARSSKCDYRSQVDEPFSSQCDRSLMQLKATGWWLLEAQVRMEGGECGAADELYSRLGDAPRPSPWAQALAAAEKGSAGGTGFSLHVATE